jgi:hypothetical protein
MRADRGESRRTTQKQNGISGIRSLCAMMLSPVLTAWGKRVPEGNCAFPLPSGTRFPQAMRAAQIIAKSKYR